MAGISKQQAKQILSKVRMMSEEIMEKKGVLMRFSSPHNTGQLPAQSRSTHQTERIALQHIDTRAEIFPMQQRLIKAKKSLFYIINRIPDIRYRKVLTMYYIDCYKTIRDVAETLHYTSGYMHHIHLLAVDYICAHFADDLLRFAKDFS